MQQNIMRFLLLLNITLVVFGCAIGPDYERPLLPSQETFQGEGFDVASEERVKDFWRYYKDPLLDELVNDAIVSNKDIRSALSKVNEARAIRREAFLNLFPIAKASASYTNSKFGDNSVPPIPDEFTKNESYRGGIDATWELDIFGNLRREVEVKSSNEEAMTANLMDALRIVVSEVARNYFELRGSQSLLSIAKRNAESQKETLRIVSTLTEAGSATELDKVRAEAQYQTTLSTIPTLESTVATYIYRLSVLTGRVPTGLQDRLANTQPIPRYDGPITIGAPKDLLRRRPDVRSAEEALHGATAGIGVAIGDLFPQVTFNGNLSLEARNFDNLSDKGSDSYSFGPRISWSILNLQGVLARIDAADARAQTALHSYEKAVLSSLEDAQGALNRFSSEKNRMATLFLAKQSSERAASLARTQYQEGATDLLTVLDSERNLFIAEDALCRSETTLQTSVLAIYKALGGGWEAVKLQHE